MASRDKCGYCAICYGAIYNEESWTWSDSQMVHESCLMKL